MPHQKMTAARRWRLAAGSVAALVVATIAGSWLMEDCDICEAATTILLQSTVPQTCTINVTADPNAANLNLVAAGAQHVRVGTVAQSCNKKIGYTIAVTSTNCTSTPTGAKVLDSVSNESLGYSVEFDNPPTGGSSDVTNLLATACAGQTGRNVTNAKISGESSTIYVNYTGNAGLGAGAYQDTLTLAMNVK